MAWTEKNRKRYALHKELKALGVRYISASRAVCLPAIGFEKLEESKKKIS